MPLTPVTSFLLDQEFVKKQWPVLRGRLSSWNASMQYSSSLCSNHPGLDDFIILLLICFVKSI